MERLQRVLASRGVASRRMAEQMILDGRVMVDGEVVRELGTKVDPERQEIRIDGKLVRQERRRYIMLNKPTGYITTMNDERGRRTVMDLVNVQERVVPVGRLDRQTAGLLLFTNDGELAYRVTHPRFELEKEYEALLDGHPPPKVLEQLRRGVTVDGEKVVPEQIRPVRNEEGGTVLRIVIHEGRNRIVRRMLERVGYPALKLTRTRVGPIQVRGLPAGAWRDLTQGELEQLIEALRLNQEQPGRPGIGRPAAPEAPQRGTGPQPGGRRPPPKGTDRRSPGRPAGGRAPADRRGPGNRGGSGRPRPPERRGGPGRPGPSGGRRTGAQRPRDRRG